MTVSTEFDHESDHCAIEPVDVVTASDLTGELMVSAKGRMAVRTSGVSAGLTGFVRIGQTFLPGDGFLFQPPSVSAISGNTLPNSTGG